MVELVDLDSYRQAIHGDLCNWQAAKQEFKKEKWKGSKGNSDSLESLLSYPGAYIVSLEQISNVG